MTFYIKLSLINVIQLMITYITMKLLLNLHKKKTKRITTPILSHEMLFIFMLYNNLHMVVCVTRKLSIFLYSYAINLAQQRCWTSKSNIAKIFCNRSSRRYNTNSHILEIGCVSCSVGGSSFIRPPLRFPILTLLKSTPTRVESGQL